MPRKNVGARYEWKGVDGQPHAGGRRTAVEWPGGRYTYGELADSPERIPTNILADRLKRLEEAGIVDATKVVRVALENAVSVASVLLLTEATLTEVPGKDEHESTPPMPGME